MEAEDPLSQLRDIHLPEPVTFWPPAPGWWVLLLLVLIGLAFLYRHAIAAIFQRRKLAAVLKRLDRALQDYTDAAMDESSRNQAGLEFLAKVNILLNRVVLDIHDNEGGVHLTGSAWLEFLDREGATTAFSDGPGSILADGIYRRRFDADANALHALASEWITRVYQQQTKPAMTLPVFLKRHEEAGN